MDYSFIRLNNLYIEIMNIKFYCTFDHCSFVLCHKNVKIRLYLCFVTKRINIIPELIKLSIGITERQNCKSNMTINIRLSRI